MGQPTAPLVLVTEFMDEMALDAFQGRAEVRYAPGLVDDRPGLLAAAADAAALIVRNRTQVDRAVLDAAPRLRAVGRLGVGLDNIDTGACAERGVAVLPAVGANADSVAEYVIAALMTLTRGAVFDNAAMLSGEWPRGRLQSGREIAGKRLALWGFGATAQAVARRAAALGMTVVAFDPGLSADHPAWAAAARADDPLAMLDGADALSLHMPLIPQTRGAVDAAALARLAPGAVVVNAARGGVLDEAALADALKAGRLGGAALDVFETEPLDAAAAARFKGVPNLILTPHIAGVTAEANVRVSAVTVANVLEALDV
jgi:(S)-sulfolactate dehydrogenase